MRRASSRFYHIPVVDFQQILDHNNSAGENLAAACSEVGFVYLSNTPVAALTEQSLDASRRLFDHPAERLRNIATTDGTCGFYQYLGHQGRRDFISAYNFESDSGSMLEHRDTYLRSAGWSAAHIRSWKRNRWPSPASDAENFSAADFRNTMTSFYAACTETAETVVRGLCLGLGLGPDALLQQHTPHDTTLELKRYPPVPPTADDMTAARQQPGLSRAAAADTAYITGTDIAVPGEGGGVVRVQAHTDLSTVTLLVQDDRQAEAHEPLAGGLQVWSDRDKRWLDAPARPPGHRKDDGPLVLVNTGDLMQAYSGGKYRSTLHRVVGTQPEIARGTAAAALRNRHSAVFFYRPRWDALVKPLVASSAAASADEEFYVGDRMPLA